MFTINGSRYWRDGGFEFCLGVEKLEATLCEMLAAGAAGRPFGRQSPASSAPWNDGRRSFSTKERLVINAKSPQKGVVLQEKGAFSTFPGDVLRTLC